MNFIIRSVQMEDLPALCELAKQASLLNLPADKKVLSRKIEMSMLSFAGKLDKRESEYLFVIEDVEDKAIAGTSLIIAKHGTRESPHYCFKVLKRDRFSKDLGIGFIHQVLRLNQTLDGPTEVGGLLVDRGYRRRPEKLGRQLSLIRFLYLAMHPQRFENRLLCELTPPLTDEGRSEFWEALGRRFTGLPYLEADLISQKHKEFIKSLFPEEDIYLTLLDSKARLVVGQVGEETKAAQHLLEKIGFQYLNEVDPFDGGPHYGAMASDVSVVKNAGAFELSRDNGGVNFAKTGLIAVDDDEFFGMQSAYEVLENGKLVLPTKSVDVLKLRPGQKIWMSPTV